MSTPFRPFYCDTNHRKRKNIRTQQYVEIAHMDQWVQRKPYKKIE